MFHVCLITNVTLQLKYYKMHEFYGNNVPALIVTRSTIQVTGTEQTQIQVSSVLMRYTMI